MNTKKLVKWGVALTSTLVLGGVVAPVGGRLLGGPAVVYADEQSITYRIHYFLNDVAENGGVPSYTDIAPYKEGVISKGETITEVAPHIDGYVVNGANSILITYDHITGDNVWHDKDWYPADGFLYDKVETPTDKPAEQPAEQPTEQPADQPAEQPAEQPTEQPADQPAEQPAEQPTEQPADQPAEQPTEQPADQPVEQPVEKPAEVPVEQPVETPAEQPAEQPVDTPTEKPAETPTGKPVDTPTDKPVEQLTDASSLTDQTAGKVQVVAATDKKTVDKSAPSTPAVKPEEVSQPVAKTLPKTGDSSSMLLVLGGVLSGLSGLGLAATSRKRD
ncbi:LPXTG cell wall anchor domain-containing protein [Streptococcus suis]|uniref:LPXTG cell wall anchor domain-containing protein n=1 Tax=Streptococcus suis TaxID=1307 RepID=UPI001C94F443|nr:LPXTG cell wall anchor domain-containing protein [Streptococcus suis]MBY5024542.1 LPXTG cell wall anchor domain-containing protein [Streptococcus suis]QZT17193.1 LPXTG cell wall anchor domain-containing protein [Streptococcus suis]